jgi:hypothetical protein
MSVFSKKGTPSLRNGFCEIENKLTRRVVLIDRLGDVAGETGAYQKIKEKS